MKRETGDKKGEIEQETEKEGKQYRRQHEDYTIEENGQLTDRIRYRYECKPAR